MHLGRLSVSLEDDQEDWITAISQELGISKRKVVRECIDEVRTGESLFTGSVSSDESPDVDRISSLEARLATLEEMVRNEKGSADDDDTAPVAFYEPHSEPVLETLPGIDPPKGSGRFYRFKY